MLRIGVAGLGFMGQMHTKSFLKCPGAQVVALADVDPERRAGKFKGSLGNLGDTGAAGQLGAIRSYEDIGAMCMDREIDAVAVCLPSDQHANATVRALEAGKHVLCEKPMALTAAEGRRMVDAAARSGKTLMIAHCLRFWPEYLAVEQIVRGGQYGRAIAASFARCGGQPGWGKTDWFLRPERSGGALLDLHVHDADVAVWWWGKPAEISTGGAFVGAMPNIIHSRWRYANGPAVQFEGAWEAVPKAPFFYAFKVTLEGATVLFDSRNDKGIQLATEAGVEKIEVGKDSAYETEDRYFVECLAAGKAVDRCPPSDSLLTLECVTEEARQLSALRG